MIPGEGINEVTVEEFARSEPGSDDVEVSPRASLRQQEQKSRRPPPVQTLVPPDTRGDQEECREYPQS